MIALILPALFALAYRARGGGIPVSNTTLSRLIWWALPVGLWGACAELVCFGGGLVCLAIGLVCFLLAWAGLMIPHSAFQGNETSRPQITALQCLGMGGVSMVRLALILAPLAWFDPVLMAYAPLGMLSGLAYFIGWKLDGVTVINTNWLSVGASWGELLTGLLAYGLPFALILAS